eukprot:PDM62816.1 hypothetical protein PRIPAC_50031 [Pristionchus pacificus]
MQQSYSTGFRDIGGCSRLLSLLLLQTRGAVKKVTLRSYFVFHFSYVNDVTPVVAAAARSWPRRAAGGAAATTLTMRKDAAATATEAR